MALPSNNVQGSENAINTKGRSGHTTSRMLHGCSHICCTLRVAFLARRSVRVCKLHAACCMLHVASRVQLQSTMALDQLAYTKLAWRTYSCAGAAWTRRSHSGMNRSPKRVWRHSLHRRSARQSIAYEKAEGLGSDMLRQALAAMNAPQHGRIEPTRNFVDEVCGAARPVCSERSPVSNRQPRPHSLHVRMSQAVFVPTFSHAGWDAARAHRRPDANRAAARRFELAQKLTVWREPNSNRSQGVWRVPLADSEHSPAPNRLPPPSDDASSNGSLSRCKASYCHRGDAFERHMHVHPRAHRCARAHARTPVRTCRLRKARRCIRAISPLL